MIITISRQFGSGGRELAKTLAEKLGYSYYDKEILQEIAKLTSKVAMPCCICARNVWKVPTAPHPG